MSLIRQSFRSLLKHPGQFVLGVAAIALGIALVSSMFSYVNGALIRGLPFDDSEDIVYVQRFNAATKEIKWVFGNEDLQHYSEEQSTLEQLVGFSIGRSNVRAGDRMPRFCEETVVSASFLEMLRVKPVLGRGFLPRDVKSGAEPVVLVSHQLWSDEFQNDKETIGRTLTIDGTPATVVGVLPPQFSFPHRSDIWVPLREDQKKSLNVIARLRANVSLEQAETDLTRIAVQLAEQGTAEEKDYRSIVISPYTTTVLGKFSVRLANTMLVCSLAVLILACANVSNLVFARTALRMPELAIRAALGASRLQIFRLLIFETMLLAGCGALLALPLTHSLVRIIQSFLDQAFLSPWITYEIDWRVFIAITLLTLLSGLTAGIIPAWRACRSDLNVVLHDSNRASTTLRSGKINQGLVAFQIAICCALLSGGWMLFRNVSDSQDALPFDSRSILSARIELPEALYPDHDSVASFYENLIAGAAMEPAITSVALTSRSPLGGRSDSVAIAGVGFEDVEGSSDESVHLEMISPGFFETLGTPLKRGRMFRSGEQNVIIINESMVVKYWPGKDPLGERLRVNHDRFSEGSIIGIVSDLKMEGIVRAFFDPENSGAGIYLPHSQSPSRGMTLLLRSRGTIAESKAALKRIMRQQDDDIAFDILPLDQAVQAQMTVLDITVSMFGAFGFGSMFLAAVGIFGMASLAVQRRLREIGLRLALGAQKGDIIRLVIRHNLIQFIIGILVGIGLWYLLGAVLMQVFPGMTLNDVDHYFVLGIGLIVVTLSATVLPTWNALRSNLITALRED